MKFAILALFFCPSVEGGGLTLLWEFKLSGRVREPAKASVLGPHSVHGLSFSPDDQFIAAAIGPHHSEGVSPKSHLVIVPVDEHRHDEFRQFDTEGFPSDTVWSSSGTYIALNGRVLVRLKDGIRCQIPEGRNYQGIGFLPDDRFICGERHGWAETGTTTLHLFNASCEELKTWKLKDRLMHLTTATEKPWVAVSWEYHAPTVFDAEMQVVRRWTSGESAEPQGYLSFLERGKVLCTADQPIARFRSPRCWDVATGREIGFRVKIRGGKPFAAAANDSVIAATDGTYSYNHWTETEKSRVKRIVLYDLQSGRVIATLPECRQTSSVRLDLSRPITDPCSFAISPSGKYFAVGRDDTIRLYTIER